MDTGALMLVDTYIPYNSIGDYYGFLTQQPLQDNRASGAYCVIADESVCNMGENRNLTILPSAFKRGIYPKRCDVV